MPDSSYLCNRGQANTFDIGVGIIDNDGGEFYGGLYITNGKKILI